ncbi:probable UDP-glucose 4-epimerase [Rhynchosporium graminicola]|uniref:Probable UDP-glucose 4-epimerase n=1 Tax=Rhynchosporium graminicola TaxID=2792576 RepID=A0A1E1JWF9_9HELO|nr:probable UDP-glucose 4-epimerase [Rhynchosporium commune]
MLNSEVNTPSLSLGSSISDAGTPATHRSALFDPSSNDTDRDYILVVGGLGYIGSHTCLELLKAGHNILIVDNLSNSFRDVFDRVSSLATKYHDERCQTTPLMRLCEADYRDETSIRQFLDQYVKPSTLHDGDAEGSPKQSWIKGVIHFAAYKSVSESLSNPLKYYANNVAGMIEFCSVLSDFNIKTFVFSSSATVYGTIANSGLPLREEYCTHQTESFVDHDGASRTTEGGCSGLTNPYGRSKWMCEAILSDLALADPEWTILALRYFNPVGCDESGLLGEDPKGIPTNLMPVVVRVMTGVSEHLNVFGTDYPTPDGTAVRDFIHVTDLACGHVAALSSAFAGRVSKGFRTFNLGSGTGSSVYEVVHALEAVSSKEIPLRNVPRREGDVGSCVALAQRAEVELKWKTQKSLETCCKDIMNFLDHQKTESAKV